MGFFATRALAWGDFDGDLDLALSGMSSSLSLFTTIYRNGSAVANTAPAAPSTFRVTEDAGGATLNWTAGNDAETPAGGLAPAGGGVNAAGVNTGEAAGLDAPGQWTSPEDKKKRRKAERAVTDREDSRPGRMGRGGGRKNRGGSRWSAR